jgi:exodeoxyribonuclease VII small subunit
MASEQNTASIAGFEKSLDELEKLVRDLEQGELSLEQSLSAFEQGVKLTRECQQALKGAEQRVEQLVQNDDGTLTTRPFFPDDANE